MDTRIAQLREKTHLDIPIAILSIMFSLSLTKFEFTVFHVVFTLLILTIILSKTMLWHLTSVLSLRNNHFVIISTYIQISLLFAVYYSFGVSNGVASLFYAGYSIFLLFYVVLVCVTLFDFGETQDSFCMSQVWATALILVHLGYFAISVVSVSVPHGIEIVVFFNICSVLLVSFSFEKQAKLKHLSLITKAQG